MLCTQKSRSFLSTCLASFVAKDADGSRGGVLTAWDSRLLSLSTSMDPRFSLTTTLSSTTTDLVFFITNIYAHSLTAEFVADMTSLALTVSGPWLIAGNFNLIYFPHEKNNTNFDAARASTLNSMINALSWFKLHLADRCFT